jgi:hypothetical protein
MLQGIEHLRTGLEDGGVADEGVPVVAAGVVHDVIAALAHLFQTPQQRAARGQRSER